jgi:hypothetical protein
MSSYPFNPRRGPAIIQAQATGPNRTTYLDLAPDTGATQSLINLSHLLYLGFDPAQAFGHTHMTTGSFVGMVPTFMLTRLGSFGQNRFFFPVIGHPIKTSYGISGLLCLDFLRDQALIIDFRTGQITLS